MHILYIKKIILYKQKFCQGCPSVNIDQNLMLFWVDPLRNASKFEKKNNTISSKQYFNVQFLCVVFQQVFYTIILVFYESSNIFTNVRISCQIQTPRHTAIILRNTDNPVVF